jgi:tetratricopeptide (TPR) repeat protein
VVQHNIGGVFQYYKKDLRSAKEHYRRALAIDSNQAATHNAIGSILREEGDLLGAFASHRRALKLNPDDPDVHDELGVTLRRNKDLDGAIKSFRTALRIRPTHWSAHYRLGLTLKEKGRLDAAAKSYRRAIENKSDYTLAYWELAVVLLSQRRYAEARPILEKVLELTKNKPHFGDVINHELAKCDRMIALEKKLTSIPIEKLEPADVPEMLDLAELCASKKHFLDAVHFYSQAFARQPDVEQDLDEVHRYNAACFAALAAGGEGKAADRLDAKQRATLREKALAWLRADLAARSQLMDKNPQERAAVAASLGNWQRDKDLASLRDADAIAKLPPDEQKAWRALWEEVDKLLKRMVPKQPKSRAEA